MAKLKILYLEDEESLAKIVKESLISRDFDVLHLDAGEHAVESFHSFKPDVCIFDVMLPGKDGFSIGKEIRAFDTTTPILYLTAKNQTSDLLEGFGSGGNDYIKKPFSLEELIVRIHNLHELSTKGTTTKVNLNEIAIGKYSFSPSKQELRIDSEIKKISYRECQLLLILTKNKGEIVTRKVILDTIWGDDHFFNSRNLDVYITKLRSYLKSDPKIEIITLKAVGYRLVD
jgi:DNA-binding response OmpR family regulator